jgi:hypothetical protein
VVSMLMGMSTSRRRAFITGMTLRSSSSTDTGVQPGRVALGSGSALASGHDRPRVIRNC